MMTLQKRRQLHLGLECHKRSKMGRHVFSYRGAKCWMEIDPELRQLEKLAGFKSQLIKRICRDINHPT